MVGGTALAALAAVPGLADWSDIHPDHEAKKPANMHMTINLVTTGLYVLNLVLRGGSLDAGQVPLMPLLLSVAGVGAISVSGYIGGLIVYDDGVGVGRHRRKTEMPGETRSAKADSSEWAAVADAGDLGEGETLRAEVSGHVMALARADGKVYAFQEFCTHRFGPLSEGALYGEQIECPWHRSCFDIRTGKVTQGPAKIDLKVFEAEERDGKIVVRVTGKE
jgi:3-phenylpropionate/trans-cinnamate dioxygenase ferredoxin subunit/anthranilate 1,2-dioxygenase ferredoxin subunit